MHNNLYELLGVASDAPSDQIEHSLRAMRKRYRVLTGTPDLQTRIDAERAMALLVEAEDTLLNPELRAAYDARLAAHGEDSEPKAKPALRIDVDALLDEAQNYIDTGSLDAALVIARRVLDADPEHQTAWYTAYRALIGLNRQQEALGALDRVIDKNSTDEMLHRERVQLFNQLNRYDQAAAYCRNILDQSTNAIEIDTSWWQATLAHSRFLMGNQSEAVMHYKQVIDEWPDSSYVIAQCARDTLSYILTCLSFDGERHFIGNEKQFHLLETELTYVEHIADQSIFVSDIYIYIKRIYSEGVIKMMSGPYVVVLYLFILATIVGLFYFLLTITVESFSMLAGMVVVGSLLLFMAFKFTYKLKWTAIAKQKHEFARSTGLQ